MRRPVGVVISCIVLGLAAVMLLLGSAGSLLSIFIIGHMPATPGYGGGQPAPPPGMMNAVFIILSLLYAALAAWAIATLIGLARMRRWARFSIIVIGSGLALIGVVGALSMIAAQAMMANMATPQGTDPSHTRIVLIIGGIFWLIFAVIGICLVVYFALRSTREAFALAAGAQPLPAVGYAAPPSPYAASSYEVASYIPAPVPNALPIAPPVPMLDQPVVTTSTPRPLTVTIIACLLFLGAAITLLCAFLPFPVFLLGVMITGWGAHLVMLSFAVIALIAAIGLLRLEKVALYAAYGFYFLGIANSILILLPSVRDRMITYEMDMMQKMSLGMPQPFLFDHHMMALMMVPGLFLSVVFCLTLLILLFINRAAFDRTDIQSTQAAAL